MQSLALDIRKEGHIATLTRSRKYHRCALCQEYINKGEQYYSITIGGGGLGSLKFPERTHSYCLDAFFERMRKSREL